MPSPSFACEKFSDGVTLRLLEKPLVGKARSVPVNDWPARMADQAFSAVSHVLALLDDEQSSVKLQDDGVFLDHRTVASLTEPQAICLGLPPSVRFALQIDTKNLVTDPNFQIIPRWIGIGNRPFRAEHDGAFVRIEGQTYRLPERLFELCESIDAFTNSEPKDHDTRMARLAEIQCLIPKDAQDQLAVDSYFASFRILHASAFSLGLKIGRDFDFDPILFGRRVVERGRAESAPISEAESLLTDYQQELFAEKRFRSSDEAKQSYVIERGIYVYMDSSLRKALEVVRQAQKADAGTRKRFVQSPQLYLKEALSDLMSDDEVENLFVETEQYSARVIDIGLWVPPVLPWIKQQPNDWLPEKFGLQIGDQYVVLKTEELSSLREQIKEARAKGEPFVEFGTEERVHIPATEEAERSLSNLIGVVKPPVAPPSEKSAEEHKPASTQRQVLIVEENFDKTGFTRKIDRRAGEKTGLPAAIRSALKAHQQGGLEWLQNSWTYGYPGVLLADDMGLGKTLQALAFLAWLRERNFPTPKPTGIRKPILIVAPTGLLKNWEKEHDLHLHEPGLGEVCRAYGRHLKVLKTSTTSNQKIPSLDPRRIQESDWVLTTYETLRDYHLSFAAIPFSCVVFDEMQKVKSPSALLTRAAKTVNASFMIGLTGTPIENQLSDLWCIFDIILPGHLGDLKSFSAIYQPDDEKTLVQLHSMLLNPPREGHAPMLRRMKAGALDGLPEKKIHVRRRPMPEAQARVYAEVVGRAKQSDSGPMLETLHLLRGVSLHPIWPPASDIKDPQAFIDQSARLIETFSILDEIAMRREKALIFLESLDLQEHLALMIKNRYALKRRPMQVNGEVSGESRQKLVDEFQKESGNFDVMILSPRAGGVGLTLTSANHVIHLSRWWNPAVEDQCTDRIYRIGQDKVVNVYYPMAIHPLYGDSSFDELLHALLTRKRDLSERMLLPPVNIKKDQSWFAENLGRKLVREEIAPVDIDEIDVMEPLAFERWALRRCIDLGWEASATPKSYDKGADGILFHRKTKACVIVQCKHKQSASDVCGPEAIDELLRARSIYDGSARMFVLSNAERFARAAQERAEKYGVSLIGRKELPDWPRQLSQ
jgi:HJR/Mrr/RecB family endonuclease